jgi:hypothetical protein
MRDDLHKTVPLSRPWGRVLHRLSAERWSAAELAPLIAATVQRELAVSEDAGGPALIDAIHECGTTLFDDGQEKMRMTLLRIQDGPLSAVARTTCEVALGVLATNGMSHGFPEQVIQSAGMEYARDQVEHMAARVAATHGIDEARQVSRKLSAALKLCDFTVPASTPSPRRRKSVVEMLATELPLRV